eukprot:12877524-Alexandrium_andersonii.AAC.1
MKAAPGASLGGYRPPGPPGWRGATHTHTLRVGCAEQHAHQCQSAELWHELMHCADICWRTIGCKHELWPSRP